VRWRCTTTSRAWCLHQQAALTFSATYPGRVTNLRFEDIVVDPVGVLGKFLAKFGVASSPTLARPKLERPVCWSRSTPGGPSASPRPKPTAATAAELSFRRAAGIYAPDEVLAGPGRYENFLAGAEARHEHGRVRSRFLVTAAPLRRACVVEELVPPRARRPRPAYGTPRGPGAWRRCGNGCTSTGATWWTAAAHPEVVGKVQPKVVLHLAAYGPTRSRRTPGLLRTTFLGTYNLLEAARNSGASLFVNTAVPRVRLQIRAHAEADRLEPNSFYAWPRRRRHTCAVCSPGGRRWPRSSSPVLGLRPLGGTDPLMPTLIRRAPGRVALEMVSPDTAGDFVFAEDVGGCPGRVPAVAGGARRGGQTSQRP